MTLIKCPECGNQVSDQAVACPSCGNPIKQDEDAKPHRRVTWGLRDVMRDIQEGRTDTAFQRYGCRYPLILLMIIPILVILYLVFR